MGASDSSILKSHFDDIVAVENTQNHSYIIQRAKIRQVAVPGQTSATGHTNRNNGSVVANENELGKLRKGVLIFSGDKHLMENLKHFSRTIRHPNLLYYMDMYSIDTALTSHIVFQSSMPLVNKIKEMTPQELIHGMHNVTNALMFIHDTCLCSYNNVLMSSIFVCDESGEWKLACLENMSKFTNSSWQVFAQNKIPSHLLPPEDSCEATVPSNFGYTRDVYMLGHLFRNDILSTQNFAKHTKVTIDCNLYAFNEYISATMLNQDYKMRPRCSQILKHSVFNNYYSTVVKFFHNFLTKSETEKCDFFESLSEHILTLDAKLIVMRILPLLVSEYVIYEPAAQKLIGDIWNPAMSIKNPKSSKGFMTEQMYKDYVVPQFLKLLQSRSIDTRILLLTHLKPILPYIPKRDVSKCLLPKLLTGLRDTNDDIVSLTFHCLGDLVPYLGSNRVVGGSRRQVFVETRPRNQVSLALPSQVESSYFAEEDEAESDSDHEVSSHRTLSRLSNSNSAVPVRPSSTSEKAPGNRKLNKSCKKVLVSDLAERLDPISEKTEESLISRHDAPKPPVPEDSVCSEKDTNHLHCQSKEQCETFNTLNDLNILTQSFEQAKNVSNCMLSSPSSDMSSPQITFHPAVFGCVDHNIKKESLSDGTVSSDDWEYSPNKPTERFLRSNCSNGSQIINRKMLATVCNDSLSDYNYSLGSVNVSQSVRVENDYNQGWDDLEWNSD